MFCQQQKVVDQMSVFEILETLESDDSRLFKESVLEAEVENSLLQQTFSLTLDPYKNWGISKYDQPSFPGDRGHGDDILAEFLELLLKLDNRILKGNAARAAVTELIGQGDSVAQKWMERILWRNLRCGVSSKIVNKTWPGTFAPFTVSLAGSLTTKGVNGQFEIEDEVKYPVRSDAKLDGLRCIAVKKGGVVTLYTRNGTVLETLPNISSSVENLSSDNFVFDGEVMGESWNDSASVVMSSKSKKDDATMRYHIFDYIPLADWQNKSTSLTYRERLELLAKTLGDDPHSTGPFRYVEHEMCENEQQLRAFYEKCLEKGYEGVMLKDLDAQYKWKRTSAILKLKPVSTEEGVVIGWYNASKKTKRAGCFGGFRVLTSNGAITRVGGGYSDKLKSEINDDPDSWIGRIVECEHQPPFTKTGALRFPVFTRFRDSSDVDPKILDAYEEYTRNENH
jgi:DNA ligase-1